MAIVKESLYTPYSGRIKTVGQLIDVLLQYDVDLLVGGSGHFGELLEVTDVYKREDNSQLVIEIESAGEEPD